MVRVAASAGLGTRIPYADRASGGAVCARAKTDSFCFTWFGVLLAVSALMLPSVRAATPPGTAITNTASASYEAGVTPVVTTGSVTVTTATQTPATIELLRYAPSVPGSAPVMVSPTQCKGANLPAPTVPGTGTLALPSLQPLGQAEVYARGEPVFVRITDYDQNKNPLLAETVVTTITTSSGDSETITLTETGPSTGVFVGFIQSALPPAIPNNCKLNIAGNVRIVADYKDGADGKTILTDAALVDPFGVFFDSLTGLPINGAQITVINVATGLPAQVFGNDGVSAYPSTVTSGSSVTDAGGALYTFPAGAFQFPRMAAGTYRFQITPPPGYAFPSTVANATLQTLAGAPFMVVAGSRGENFLLVDGPALQIDIPLDPAVGANVQITKTVGKSAVAIGDFVPYTLSIANGGTLPIAALRIADRMPLGFRYQGGSARLGTIVLADPLVSNDGRHLTFSLGVLAAGTTATVRYVAVVGPSAQVGPADNTAQAVAPVTSNVARASVLVREDLNRSTSILLGRVTVAENCNNPHSDDYSASSPRRDLSNPFYGHPVGIKGVRVMLQDGTYIVTDEEGRWHADNIRPGTHVVQLDEVSLPKDIELESCEQNTRTGGRNFSQFVNVRGGTLWRADFRFKRVTSCLAQQVQVRGKSVRVTLNAGVANQAVSASIMLPGGAKVLADSIKLDGRPYSQATVGDGFVVARLGAQPGKWQHVLEFELEQAPASDVSLKVQVQPVGQEAQGLAALVLKAPATEVAVCTPIAVTTKVGVQAIPAAPTKAAGAAPVVGGAAAAAASPATPTLQLVEQLPYDDKWIAAAGPGAEWLHPQTGFAPALPVIKVAVKHDAKHVVELRVNGEPVGALRFEGATMNAAGTLALSNWRAVDLREGANQMAVTVRDAQGQTILQEARTIHYSVAAATVVYDAKRSRLVADGRTPPLIAVRMLDKIGQPVRRGSGGEVQVSAPYLSLDQANAIQREPLTGNLGGKAHYEIGEDGVALIALQPTTQAGEVVLKFDFGNNGRTQEIRAWLTPEMREWVLVGFAEGTVGFKGLSGNMVSLNEAAVEDRFLDQNRVAFYGKGQIKGEYLMTVAYDSAKGATNASSKALKQAIDPNQFYTLYADATQPQFDAASVSKLYLKIEKSQFYALFGDFDTGLTVTELGRYSRTLNGIKSEYKGDVFSYSAFASQTSQSFRKDEIQGDGTSGLYRLSSRDIVVNSDKLSIEVRDRLRPEIIISSRQLTRYLDYQIDFALGTLSFTQPIAARDEKFNPTFIVAEYESESLANATVTFGGRVAAKVGDKTEVGLTLIKEGISGREASLTAADATVQLGEKTKLHAELAQSQRISATGPQSGNASVVELTHDDGKVAARAYARQQDAGFGLGQQAASEAGTRKIGVDVQVKVTDQFSIKAETYTQDNQVSNAKRDVAEVLGTWSADGLNVNGGLRMANENSGTGTSNQARQLLGGLGYDLLDKRLTLRANTELNLSGQTDSQSFPNRLILGADYRLTPQTTLFAQHELARSSVLQADTTRVGLRTQVWEGGEVASSLGNQAGTDGNRLFGNLGLVQKWKLNDNWSVDFGIDRSQTFSSSPAGQFSAAQPLASGTLASNPPGQASGNGFSGLPSLISGDYTAAYIGASYKNSEWSSNARAEWRISDTDRKINLLLGAQRNLESGRAMAAGLNYNLTEGTTNTSLLTARLSYAHRPLNSALIWLDRLEYQGESRNDASGMFNARKLINNFNANWLPNRSTQIAIQHGAKVVFDTIDGAGYQSLTTLVGLEARHDISERLDVGLHFGSLRSWGSGARDFQVGVSVGFKVADNAWLSVGYNQRGFNDPDFAGAQYRVEGLYLNLRFKFDQNTFNLNDRQNNPLPLKP